MNYVALYRATNAIMKMIAAAVAVTMVRRAAAMDPELLGSFTPECERVRGK